MLLIRYLQSYRRYISVLAAEPKRQEELPRSYAAKVIIKAQCWCSQGFSPQKFYFRKDLLGPSMHVGRCCALIVLLLWPPDILSPALGAVRINRQQFVTSLCIFPPSHPYGLSSLYILRLVVIVLEMASSCVYYALWTYCLA